MIIRLIDPDGTRTHFDVPNASGYAPARYTWNHRTYSLVSTALDPLPVYHCLPPDPRIEARWVCAAPQRLMKETLDRWDEKQDPPPNQFN